MLLELQNVSKIYKVGDEEIRALNDVSVAIEEGEFVAVMGPSGSGKSTFLQVASMLSNPTQGDIFLKEKNVTKFTEVELARLRNQEIGFIFQQFNLLARTSALDNVALPLVYAGISSSSRQKRSREFLERVGLGDRLYNTPAQLSGGQQQRVAIARALVNHPAIIFADEPTGNLDSKSGAEIKKLLQELHNEGKTIVMVTHEAEIAHIAKRLILFHDGEIIYDEHTGFSTTVKNKETLEYIKALKKKAKSPRHLFGKRTGK
jgi:putative ABC transport system ATP-binding protein